MIEAHENEVESLLAALLKPRVSSGRPAPYHPHTSYMNYLQRVREWGV